MAVHRERLHALLLHAIPQSVILVVAPPAYGKTTLLLDYLQLDPTAKLVTASTAEPGLETFVRDVIAAVDPKALRSIGPLFDQRGADGFRDALRAWFLGRLRRVHSTIVIDDLQRFSSDSAAMWLLQEAVENTAGRIRWIIATRDSSGVPVGTWVARDIMGLPITEDDLAFTHDESVALARDLDVEIGDDDLTTLLADTNGWPLGMRLSLELRKRTPSLEPIRFRTRDVLFRYLDDEVWKSLPVSAHEWLYACAILPSVSVEALRAAGFADAGSILDELQVRVPFVQRRHDDTFVLHDLFRDYVLHRLKRDVLGQTLAPRLAEELIANGRRVDAVTLLTTAQCATDLSSALATCALDLVETGHRVVVQSAVSFLAQTAERDSGIVLAVRGALALSDGSSDNATALYERALALSLPPRLRAECASRLTGALCSWGRSEHALEVITPLLSDDELSRDDRVAVQAVCASACATVGRAQQTRDLIERVLPKLQLVSSEVRAVALLRLGSAAFYIGDLVSAESFANDTVALCSEIGRDGTAAHAYSILCAIATVSDRTCVRAVAFAKQLTSCAERAGNLAMRIMGLNAQLELAVESGDFEAAESVEGRLLNLPDSRTNRDSLPICIARGLLCLSRNEGRRAAVLVAGAQDRNMSPAERAYRDVFAGALQLIEGHRDDAQAVTKRPLLLEATEDFVNRRYAALTYAFRGVLLWALDRPAQARRAFAQDTTFLPERDHVLIEALRAVTALPHPLPNPSAFDWICELLHSASLDGYALLLRKLAEREAAHVTLTPSEIETLRAFNELGQTTAQIAEHLGKSYHTVDTQVKSIIRKLGCSGRAEALTYARKQGWL
jgi:ATP/maltotriose-dependent transcriptional regulator MalT